MKIQRFLHSCLYLQEGDTSIIFDPGRFCFVEAGVQQYERTEKLLAEQEIEFYPLRLGESLRI